MKLNWVCLTEVWITESRTREQKEQGWEGESRVLNSLQRCARSAAGVEIVQ